MHGWARSLVPLWAHCGGVHATYKNRGARIGSPKRFGPRDFLFILLLPPPLFLGGDLAIGKIRAPLTGMLILSPLAEWNRLMCSPSARGLDSVAWAQRRIPCDQSAGGAYAICDDK